jgi:hypothetical protein
MKILMVLVWLTLVQRGSCNFHAGLSWFIVVLAFFKLV